MNKNAIEKQLSQEKSQVVRNNFESFFDFLNLSLTIIYFAAGVECRQLEQGGGEDEPERGGVAVEDPQQLRLAGPGVISFDFWWLEGVGGTNEFQPNMRQGFLHLFARWLVARWSRGGARA